MPSGNLLFLPVLMTVLFANQSSASAQMRDRAVLSLTFDELASESMIAADSGKGGKIADAAALSGSATRIPSAFVTGSNGYSLLLDTARKQQIVIANSEDISRSDAVTVSGLFASLHPLDDPAVHGLFAKRKFGGGDVSNFGINFQPSLDNFQVYVNDGTGFKVAHYSVKAVLGFGRRVHLSLSLDQGDAPGADADADADDIRVRLFVNGAPATPSKSSGGLVEGSAAWLQDASLASCVNDAPMTIGSSFPDGELMRMICDEIHVFSQALSDEESKALFAEVTGTSAAEITAEQGNTADAKLPPPQLVRFSSHSAEVGKTTRMTVVGSNLAGARLHSDVQGLVANVADGGNATQAIFDVTVDASVTPGRYLVRCVTSGGVSNPLVISVDHVPTHPDGTFVESSPATSFPVSASGLISGAEQKRLWFRGNAGQKLVTEVEARRIGSKLDSVVEIRSQEGTPLAIQWQQAGLRGDARASIVLPADGLYFAEVHDLQFRAPGASPWRLLLGDLPPSALAFPPTIAVTDTALRTVGAEAVSETVSVTRAAGQLAIQSGNSLLALPSLRTETGTHVVEPLEGTFPAAPVDATFTASPFPALLVSGRISLPKESDAILLTVTPGQSLHFSVAARALSSPLRAHLTLFNGDALVAQNDGESGASDPLFTFTVPEGVTQLRVQVRDINHNGSPASTYRLMVARADRQAFLLSTSDGALRLPINGSVPLRLSLTRQSASFKYTGSVKLSVKGLPGITIVPDTIPASDQNQQVLVMVTRSASVEASAIAAGQGITIEAKAEGPEPVFSTSAMVEADAIPTNSLTLPDTTIVAGPADAVNATILLDSAPPVLFRGLTSTIAVRVIPLNEQVAPYVRFEMISTEPVRREDPNKPDSPLKPLVALDEFQFGLVSQAVFPLTVRVPVDTPSSTINCVLSGDFVSQPLAAASGSKSWTAPMLLAVDDAVTLSVPVEPVNGAKAATVNVTGTVHRHPLFSEAVTVVLDGLPQGYSATPIMLPADQSAYTLAVAVPEAATAGEVPNLTLRAQHSSGATISKPVPIKLIIQ